MGNRFVMNITKSVWMWFFAIFVSFATYQAQALSVDYTLDNIFLQNGRQMTGSFTWDYAAGDFEGGSGTFSTLSIPGTSRPITDLAISFDIKKSIEFSLIANLNNVDFNVSLVFFPTLSPTQSALLDLVNSKFFVADPGSVSGPFVSGKIAPVLSPVPLPAALPLFGSGLAFMGFIGWQRKRRPQKSA